MLAAIALAVVAPEAGAAARADLTVTKLSEPPSGLQAGAALAVTDTVRNAGRRKAKNTVVVYWLSSDRRRNAGDVRAGRRSVKALKARRSARGRATLTLPASLPAGAYHLIACADGTAKVRERSERNNCRASRGSLTVTAAGLPGIPALPVPTPAATPAPEPAAPAPTPTPAPADPPAVPDFPLAADPLTVTHTLDTANAVTQHVQVSQFAGATITATGEDGTTFELELPPGSLVAPVDITMTPVKAVNGTPLSGGLVGAVEILPHGLELLQPATLTITPGGSAGPVEGQTGFLSHEQGEDFHLYPLDLGETLKLTLTHFSTPGVAQSTAADRQVVLAHPPERHRAQYEQMMSALLRDARIKAMANEETKLPTDQIAAILRGYYDDIVAPLVQQAQTDDTVATEATSELLSWARQVDLLSLHEHPLLQVRRDAVMDHLKVILENAINKGYQRCVVDHDLDFIARLVGLARAAALLGLGLDEAALDKAERCGTFRLDFDSRFTVSTTVVSNEPGRSGQTTGAWRVKTPAEGIEIPMSGVTMTGSLSYAEFSFNQFATFTCGQDKPLVRYDTVGLSTVPDHDVWVLLGIDLNPREPGTPPPAKRDIRVSMLPPDDLQESYRETNTSWCTPQPSPPRDFTEERWSDYFGRYHDYVFDEWTMGAGDVVAYYDFNGSNENHGTTASTHLTLRHVPAS